LLGELDALWGDGLFFLGAGDVGFFPGAQNGADGNMIVIHMKLWGTFSQSGRPSRMLQQILWEIHGFRRIWYDLENVGFFIHEF
jgi:hypothetical protein